jgi:uncharacterized protein YndB with AHSA1/START domain
MPSLTVTGRADAAVEEVWKLLFDPTAFPRWWVGHETVRSDSADSYTAWQVGYPDFPMPQKLRADRAGGRVTISCQVSNIDFAWQLTAVDETTLIEVQAIFPDSEAHRVEAQRQILTESIARLARLAEAQAA